MSLMHQYAGCSRKKKADWVNLNVECTLQICGLHSFVAADLCVCVLWRWGCCMFSICSFNFHFISSSVWLHTFTILDRLCHLQLCWKRRIEVESQTVYLWSLKLHLMSRSSLQATTEEEEDTSAPIIREGNKIWCWKCKYTVFINPYWHWRSCVWKHLQLEVKISRLSPSPVQWVSYKTVEMFPVCERLQQVAVMMITQQLTSRSQRCGWNVTFKISNLSFTRSPAQLWFCYGRI